MDKNNFINFPFPLLKAIMAHPTAEYKVISALMFILKQ